MAKLQLNVVFDNEEIDLDRLWHRGVHVGFIREDPKKSWTEAEKREAARYFIQRVVNREA